MSKRRRPEEDTSQDVPPTRNTAAQAGRDGVSESGSQSPHADVNLDTRRVLASVACNTCRARKSKCDEQWPVCGACARLKLRCKYEQRRKSKIDTYLQNISDSLQQLQDDTNQLTSKLGQSPISDYSLTDRSLLVTAPPQPVPAQSDYRHSEDENKRLRQPLDLDFPQFRHITAAHELYTWPEIARALPNVDMTYPVTSERTRRPLTASIVVPYCLSTHSQSMQGDWWDSMNISQVRMLLNHYFDSLYQAYPIVEKKRLLEFGMQVALESGLNSNPESCLILLALALGNLVAFLRGENEWSHDGMDDASSPAGIGFFNKARQILAFLPKGQVGTAQCHVLAGIYYAQILRVYDFWDSVHEAAVTFFNIISTSPEERNSPDVTRGYWVTYILECTILSELDLPPSGLYQLQDSVPMAFGHDDAYKQDQNSETECQFVLLANIALRRLLNRAYQSMCSPSWMGSPASGFANPSTSISDELALQLDNWFSHLPPSIAIQMKIDDERNRQRYPTNLLGLLRGRYWAAKFVLCRPYVYKALSSPPEALTAEDLRNMEECIDAGLQVPQECGLLTERARLIVSPFAPIRSFMATYTLLCAMQDAPHLRHYAIPKLRLAEEIRQKIRLEFEHLAPLIQKDMELLERFRIYVESIETIDHL